MSKTQDINLSEKEQQVREFILNGSMFKVMLRIGLPIAFFQSLNHFLRILDVFMAASIDANAVSMVTFLGQINMIIAGLGLGLAAGASLKISAMYGSGDYLTVRKQINSLLFFAVIFCLGIMILILPLTTPILRLSNVPEEFIGIGRTYFTIEFMGVMLMILNGMYIALERVQGNAKRILKLNIVAMVIRLSFTAFSVYILREGITFIAISVLISQSFIFVVGLYNLNKKSEVFKISLKDVTLKKELLRPMILVSIPIMIERSTLHFGKALMSSMLMSVNFLLAGGLSISNMICGVGLAPQMGFQEAGIPIIAQNMGAKRYKRIFEGFKAIFVINTIQAILFFLPLFFFAHFTTGLFANNDMIFHEIIHTVHIWDVWSVLVLGSYAAVKALLFGLGYTKLTLILNFCRIFLFRIPVLWFLQHLTNVGDASGGIAIMLSNILVSILSILIATKCVRQLCQKYEISFWNVKEVANMKSFNH